jgi:C4-dicarboxylate-specific signal transduction histidine kinase
LLNLVLNAFEAMAQNGEAPREVQLSVTQRDAGWLNVAVLDSGMGIDPAVMPMLFQAFFTTKPKGMGMGLSIVRSIIEPWGPVVGDLQSGSRRDYGVHVSCRYRRR